MTTAPITFQWIDGAMVPMRRFSNICGDAFVANEFYTMDVIEERSWRSHKHYFAALHEGWANLPERYSMEPWAQSDTHLRRYALIKTGWSDSQTFTCGSQAEAHRWAANMRPLDDYSIVVALGPTVVRYTAKSQSIPAMGARDFQKSKVDVLDFVSDLIDTTRGELEAAAEQSA